MRKVAEKCINNSRRNVCRFRGLVRWKVRCPNVYRKLKQPPCGALCVGGGLIALNSSSDPLISLADTDASVYNSKESRTLRRCDPLYRGEGECLAVGK